MRDLSISVYFARAVLKNAVAQGLDPISLLRRNRISPRLMLEDNARISIERFADLQVSTMQAMGDEALGYGGRRLPIGSWSMMCHAVIGCETLGQALSRYCRFYQMFELSLCPALEEDEELARVQLVASQCQQAPNVYLHELML
ncbi:MAG: AraC family transcriptional regulator ligand-binding domain-containing protein, partial [Halioglobus sp.]